MSSSAAYQRFGQLGATAREPAARLAARLLLYGIMLLSFANYNLALFGGAAPPTRLDATRIDQSVSPQQYMLVGLWVLLFVCTLLPRVLRRPLNVQGTFWPLLFLLYVTLSIIWSGFTFSAASKALVFAITSITVWRLTSVFSIEEFFDAARHCLYVLTVVSAVLVIVDPQVAITQEWQHEGDWQGIWGQKQELGVTSAFLVFLCLMQLLRRWNWLDAFAVALGLVMLVGSGSRGGAVIAGLGPLLIMIARPSPRLLPTLVWVLVVETAIAIAGMVYLLLTGNDTIQIGNVSLDFTQRTMIWSYALGLWETRPWLGFGINAFWTDPQILWGFIRTNGWAIDNYHSGYVTILVETGVVGMLLFLVIFASLCSALRRLTGRLSRNTAETCLGVLIMLFTINLTETAFLRSTNFGQIAFSFICLNVICWPARRVSLLSMLNNVGDHLGSESAPVNARQSKGSRFAGQHAEAASGNRSAASVSWR